MNLKEVQSIIKNFEKSNLTELELDNEGFHIRLSKLNSPSIIEPKCVETVVEEKPKEIEEKNKFYLKSPIVGTFYAASGPNQPPFVKVGDKVTAKQTVCIIEAMKIMNEITSPIDGVVTEIKVTNGEAVGFDQVLMVIE